MKYRDFKETHPDYDPEYWCKIRAFYAGGKKLLGDQKLLKKVLPKHEGETDDVYRERCERAQYTPYVGEILDGLVAEVCSRPVTVEEPTGEFYDEFFEDVSPAGGKTVSVNALVADALREALTVRTQWTLVDLPSVELPEGSNAKDQDEAGALNAYCVNIPAEQVINWEEDPSGELIFAVLKCPENRSGGPGKPRGDVKMVYTWYTRTTWEKWSIVWKDGQEPKDDQDMKSEGGGTLTFGRVPLVRFCLPEGLWAGNKLESMARSWFNKRNALDWSQFKNLLPMAYAKIAATDLDPDGADGTQRLMNQKGGPGRVLILGEKDDLGYATPPAEVYTTLQQDLKDLRDEMHRIEHVMAQSVDNSGAALQRSGASKQADKSATVILCKILGSLARTYVEAIYRLVQIARGDAEGDVHTAGMDEFGDEKGPQELVDTEVALDAISIPSPTFHRISKFRLAKTYLGKDANEKDLKAIQAELLKNITDETVNPPPPQMPGDDGGDSNFPPT